MASTSGQPRNGKQPQVILTTIAKHSKRTSVSTRIRTCTTNFFLSVLNCFRPTRDENQHVQQFGLATCWQWLAGDLVAPLVAIGVLITALVFGGKSFQIKMKTMRIFDFEIDEDLQIAILGLVNKLMDLLVQHILERMALLYATTWIVHPIMGATVQDIEGLKLELTKPWVAASNFHKRRRTGWLRFLLCLTVSTCVVLLGLGMNTLAWPKRRWYPNAPMASNGWKETAAVRRDRTIHTPLMTLDHVDWAEDMRLGLEVVGGIPQLDDNGEPVMTSGAADELAGGLSSATLLTAITRLPGTYNRQPRDWYNVIDGPLFVTGIHTIVDGSETQSISVQSNRIVDLFNEQRDTGPSFARGAVGFTGHANLTLPLLTTSCSNVETNLTENQITVSPPSPASAILTINIGPSSGLNFTGCTCIITVSQVLFPVMTWIVDMAPTAYAQIHDISASPVNILSIGDTSRSNAVIASRLANHTSSIMPMLNGLLPSNGIAPILILTSRQLQLRNSNITSDAAGLGPVIAILAQHQLSMAAWTQRSHNDSLIPSYPIGWQIYGAGPRLAWEWIAAAILVCVILAIAEFARLLVKHRVAVRNFLSMGSLMRAANLSEKIGIVGQTRSRQRKARKKKEETEEELDAVVKMVMIVNGDEKAPRLKVV